MRIGRIYVAGGMTARRARLASMEAFDPREGRWVQLQPMTVARSSCSAAGFDGKLFVAGGAKSDEMHHDSMECFELAAGRWRPCAPLGLGRSNLALMPL